jgi:hypothetical protein
VNVVPFPTSLRTSIRPPLRSTMPSTVDKPRPVPDSSALVVKNGSKIRSRVAASIPHPLSLTSSDT